MALKKIAKSLNKVMPKPMQPNNLLKNKFVLYVTAIVSVLNVIKFVFQNEFEFLFLFVILALFSSNFSKNMIVNLLTAIIGTNLIYLMSTNKKIHLKALLMKEGFEDLVKKNGENKEKEKSDNAKPGEEKGLKGKENMENQKKPQCFKHENDKWLAHSIDCENCDEEKKREKCKSLGKNYDFCVEGSCKAEAFVSSDIPSSEPESLENKTVDRKSTVEKSYDNLEKVIGGDNIQRLTGDTKKLMEQQKGLVDSLKSIGPVLEQSSKIMKDLPIEQMTKMLSSIK